jgi:fatty acid desaturase
MLPRYRADYRTLLWVLAMPVVVFVQYRDPTLIRWLWPLTFYLAVSASVMAHNHNHSPTFKNKRANAIFANWISIFYGYPTFAWVPTHNLNHHKYVNRAGDATITWRFTNSNNALVAFTYFFVSSYYQSPLMKEYIRKAKVSNPKLYRTIITQHVFFWGTHAALCATAIAIHGWVRGLYVFGLTLAAPAVFALWTVMLFNYMQHVHTDPWSRHNHSRSFVSPVLNFLLFNNGFHAAHHENAGAHWSELPKVHAKIAPYIAPELKCRSFWGWILKHLVFSIVVPSWRTKQLGRAPFDPPDGQVVRAREAQTAPVDALEAGTTAQMV